MKITVVGGGRRTRPSWSTVGRLQDVLPVEELVLVDPAADRLELVGALARRILARLGHPGRSRPRPSSTPALEGVDAVLLQLRVGGQAARVQDETWPLECGCVGQETTGAGGLAKALRTVPVVLDIAERVRRSRARRVDHRLHQPGRHRHPRPARGGAPCGRAVQRGHRLPAHVRRAAGRRPRTGRARPRRSQPPDLGAAASSARRRRPAARAAGRARRRHRRGRASCRAACWTRSASCRPTTCATSTPTTRWCAELRTASPRRPRWPRSSGSCSSCTPTRRSTRSPSCWRSAAVPTTPRQRCSWPPRCWAPGRAEQPGGQHPQRRHAALPARRRGDRDARPVDRAGLPLPVPALEPLYAGLVATRAAYEELALDAALRGGHDRVFGRCSRTPSSASSTGPRG